MYPMISECSTLGIVLQWCEADPVDLDLYIFVPDKEGGDYVLDQPHAEYWAKQIPGMKKYRGGYYQVGPWPIPKP